MTLQEIEDKLIADTEAGLKDGWSLAPFFIHNEAAKRCCVLGMVVRDHVVEVDPVLGQTSRSYYVEAAKRLGIGQHDAKMIAFGFDSGIPNPLNSPYYDVGVRLNKRFNQLLAKAEDAE